ncbi:hypothetical protein [Maribacter polysaccharolyticus]|uniref:hypothetical protein n=1 Tax=Maribacter polysaccharolyticus TaxID=3020831 RepID=UPI00237F821B|nr:hypothetical protein [Maribacter polysaccharolyticus]MDE3743023.1 hypothetical protein [Maribacter polysaccharolyticus]
MKRIYLLFFVVLVLGCSGDSGERNPYLNEVSFNYSMNLNLPLYSPLTNTGSAIYVGYDGVGIAGIFVINSGFNIFVASEASCPNHSTNDCSTMTLDGQTAICPCDDYEYSLFTGQMLNKPDDGNRYYDMLIYNNTYSGNVVTVYN